MGGKMEKMNNPYISLEYDFRLKKIFIWAIVISLMIAIICITIAFLSYQGYTIRFEMDNNTLEAIKSINYTAILEAQK
jgi:hypothetical protein